VPFSQGSGTVQNPYVISTWSDLNYIRDYLSSHFILDQNLSKDSSDFYNILFPSKNYIGPWIAGSYNLDDLVYYNSLYWYANKTTVDQPSISSADWVIHAGFVPIGTSALRFTGSFNGNNNYISDLYIYRPTTDYIGLFGANQGASSKLFNLNLTNIIISGKNRVGGLIGELYSNSTVENVSASGKVSAVDDVGGIVGYLRAAIFKDSDSNVTVNSTGSKSGVLIGGAWSSSISNSSSQGTVSGSVNVGGLVGRLNTTSSITNSFSKSIVSGNNSVGGLVGEVSSNSYIEKSFSSGNVSGVYKVGGFVGYLYATGDADFCTVRNSYSLGDVNRLSGANLSLGGFIGDSYHGKKINNYSTGKVFWQTSPHPTNKGFLGVLDTGGSYEMIGNFWDINSSLQTTSVGEAIGKTTTELKDINTFILADWNIVLEDDYVDEIWKIRNTLDYPWLGWEENISLVDLNILKTGNGTGTVTSTPSGITCGETCSYSFNLNDEVTLSALAQEGSEFIGWSGEGCSGTGTCVVSMTQARAVTAEFNLSVVEYTLTVLKNPISGGVVTGDGNYAYNSSVTVTATPNTGYNFLNWTDQNSIVSSSPTYDFNMPDSNKTLTANFQIKTYTLTYISGGNGSISGLTSQTINHGEDGTEVQAIPDQGYYFLR